MTRINTMKS